MKEILLTRGMVALVDDGDYLLLSKFKWHAQRGHNTWYAVTTMQGKAVKMHRILCPSFQVDHRNRNGLDNQRHNLRDANDRLNQGNQGLYSNKASMSSKFKGVVLNRKSNTWKAFVRRPGKRRYIGSFPSEELAARAYDSAAKEAFGEFARTNADLGLL